ncbi:MAG: hypothetical protein MJZ38_04015 [archaeon]|nr:hypothetical protein [archaeon]
MSDTGTVIDYRYPEGSDTRRDAPAVAVVLIGLTCLTLGLYRLGLRLTLLEFHTDSLALLIYSLSAAILVMSVRSLRNHIITESILMILTAFSAIMYTVSGIQNSSEMMDSALLYALGFISCMFIFASRGERFLSAISGSMAVIIVSAVLIRTDLWKIPVFFLFFNGAGFLLQGGMNIIGVGRFRTIPVSHVHEVEEEDFPEVLVSTIGVLMFGMMSFSVGIRMLSDGELMISIVMFKLVMGLIVMFLGMYATYHGIVGEGLAMSLVALSSVIFAISMLLFEHTPHYFDMILGALLLPVSVTLLYRRNLLLGITVLLLATVMLTEVFWRGSMFIELIIIGAKGVSTAFCLITWFKYDVGRKPRPIQLLEDRLGVEIF